MLLSSSCEKPIIDEETSNSAAIKVLWRVWIHLIWCLACCMNNETPTQPSISSFLSETSSPGNSLLPDSERYFSMDGKRMWPSPCGAPPHATYASVLYISPLPVEKGKENKKIDEPIMAKVHVILTRHLFTENGWQKTFGKPNINPSPYIFLVSFYIVCCRHSSRVHPINGEKTLAVDNM